MLLALLVCPSMIRAAEEFESRTWTDRLGRQLTSTFVDAKNGEAQLKNSEGEIVKFKLADFSEPDQKYLRDLANYRRKLAAGEKVELPADPAKASLEIQPRSEYPGLITQPPAVLKPLFDFPIRAWTDTTGKKIQGKLVTAYSDKVVIDVKGKLFDLPVTRLSGDDQQYISTQLRGLQRDDLVADLAKAANAGQQPNGAPAATPAPAAVAANTPAPGPTATPAADNIEDRLAQLKSQLQGNNPETANQAAPNNPPAQPTEDINTRLAQLRQQLGDSSRGETSSGPSPAPPIESARSRADQIMQEHQARMEQQRQEAEERRNQIAAENQARQEQLARNMPRHSSSSSGNSSQVLTKQCGKCGRALPGNVTAGDKCPGCGITFDYDETNGKRSTASVVSIVGGIAVVVVGFFIRKAMSG